jgi:hypothetical protein
MPAKPPLIDEIVEEIIDIASDTSRSFSEEAKVIARKYHDLCIALAEPVRVGGDDLNWAGFAQWSSKAIGANLELDKTSPFWTRVVNTFRIPTIFGVPVRAIGRTLLGGSYGRGLSLANRSIFLEIATLYTNLLDEFPDDTVWRSIAFSEHKLSGPANDELLLTAARMLQRAKDDEARRSELVLGASIALSAYEQARAQPSLEFVFYRPVRWLLRISWKMPYCLVTRAPLRRYAIYTECHESQNPVVRRLESWWVRLYSRVLALDTPLGPICLATELVPPAAFRPALENPSIPAVKELVERFRPLSDPARNRGVTNWLDYGERMRFIVSYFMMYQNVPEMFDPPFGPEPSRRRRLRRALGALPARLSRVIPIPRIVDPSLVEVETSGLQLAPMGLSDSAEGETDLAPAARCQSQRIALRLSMTHKALPSEPLQSLVKASAVSSDARDDELESR